MVSNDAIFNKIAQALLIDYSSVYYVNAITSEYQWYSINPEFHSLQLEQGGTDFFKNMVRDAAKVVYEEDIHIFTEGISKDKLLGELTKGRMQSIEYRLMIDGKPVYHALRLIRGMSDDDDYFILGVINIDEKVRARRAAEKLEKEREIFNQIAGSLAGRYDTLYYVDIETNHYFEFSSTDNYKKLHVPSQGDDFFEVSRENINKYIHPDDKKKVMNIHYKDEMLKNLENRNSYTTTYRLIIDGSEEYYRHTQIMASDKKHIIVCIENINDEVYVEREFIESQRKSVTYGQIAESLASHYDVIYYVDSIKGGYIGFTSNDIYGNLEIQEAGNDFFYDSKCNAEKLIHPEDINRILGVLEKDNLTSILEDKKQFSTDYRIIVEGNSKYTRLTVMWSSDKRHFIIGVENIDEEIRREVEHLSELRSANEKARRDEMTGVRNKNAYQEFEDNLQKSIDSGDYSPFAIVICDINDLKLVNDTLGHKAGDEYIKSACKMICDVFAHSPVFRVGGDEFAIILSGRDYEDRDNLLNDLRSQVDDNIRKGEGPIIASGICEYNLTADHRVSVIFECADSMMYVNKRKLKEKQI